MNSTYSLKPLIKRAFWSGMVLACAFSFLGWADDLAGIKAKVAFVNSIQAEFTQEKHLEILNTPLISKGMLYFQVPASLRWEYTGPVRNVLIMTDENIRQFVQAGGEMVEQKHQGLEAMRIVLRDICSWIQGDFKANPDLTADVRPGRTIVLTPIEGKAMARVIQRIELKLTDTPGILASVKIVEGPDSYTVIRFHDTKINQPIQNNVFQELNP